MGRPLLAIALLSSAPAAAQAPSELPATLAGELVWQRVGLVGAGASDLAVVPASSGVWAVITDAGEVWVTLDAGASFTRALGRVTAETDPRRRIEARIQELIDDLEAATAGAQAFDPSATDESAVEALQREIGTLQDQLDEIGQEEPAEASADRTLLPRVWATEDGLFAGRQDGLWRSDDLGGSWRQVLEVPTHGLARVPGRSLWAAGTDDGMRFSVDGSVWLDPEDGTEGLVVSDLVAGQDGVWAATADGVWFAPDAQTWAKTGGSGAALRVRPDPDWVQGAWVATPGGVLRTDDGGTTLRASLGAQIPGVSSLLWLGTGRLLVAGAEGVWETVDGGTTWAARSRGLADPDTRADAQDGTLLLLAAAQGVYRLVPGSPAEEIARRPTIALEPLIAAATDRRELEQHTGNRWAATVLPSLDVDFDWATGSSLDWGLLTGTTAGRESAWGISVGFTWTPHSQTSLDEALLPIEALWLVDDGAMSAAFAAADSRDASRYRIAVSQQVADLYFARADLASAAAPTAPLGEQVETALRIAEIDAALDSLTNGTLSRLRQETNRENP
jgi:hypothetical protein